MIDSGFALRVLLEFYRCDRKNRFNLIKEAFESNNYKGCINVSFKAFRKVVQTNFEISDLEVANLYRECWCIG